VRVYEPSNPLIAKPERPLPDRMAVIGAGTIGPDIAYYLKSNIPGLDLVLVDVDPSALDRAVSRIRAYTEKGVAKKKITSDQAEDVMSNLRTAVDDEEIAGADWVMEAATENLELKREIFKRVESLVEPDALITSNTSSLPAEWLFEGLEVPERATVTHFFAPAFQNPAVEVVDWARVDPEVVSYLRWVFAATGKVPLVTADEVCFMLDRIFDNWCNEAGYLLDSATASEIDSVVSEFVHAGPFFVLNLANGNPIIIETNNLQMQIEGEHYRPAPIFGSVERWKTIAPGQTVEVDDIQRIRDRMLGILFSQSVDICDRSIGSAEDLELGCILALGFKRGPFALMESEGERILGRLAKERPGMPMPSRPVDEYQSFRRHILIDDLDGVKILTIRRPQALNALDDEVNDEILEAIQAYENDSETRGFVITGFGSRAFCAGADIGRFTGMLGDREASTQYARDCSRVLVHLDRMTKPVVAALNGFALGGGLELAFRCHAIVAHRDAYLQLPEITLGIAPGIGAMVVPYRRWPQAAAVFHRMLRLAEKLPADDAAELGIIDELADDVSSLIRLAVRRVEDLAPRRIPDEPVEIPPFEAPDSERLERIGVNAEVLSIMEKAIAEAASASSLEQALEIGYRAFGDTACTEAAREKISAFIDR